eukprot:TRINITY_DN3165_c0_g1_i1.p1 TRINITY_DN3165_c0_g1~~TRINITY_DN3165_c0_g1_i1.p1  ORF type:complete len:788 (+),score=171.64 TRINITY_DN3165_c0_g1_i1:18-2381(+)
MKEEIIELNEIQNQFQTSKINLFESEENVTDKEMIEKNLRFLLTGKENLNFFQRNTSPQFIFNFIFVMRTMLGCVFSCILFLWVDQIKEHSQSYFLGIIIASIGVQPTLGITLRGIFMMISTLIGIAIATAFASVTDLSNRYGTTAFIFAFVVVITMANIKSFYTSRLSLLFFLLHLLICTNYPSYYFRSPLILGYKLGVTCLVGFFCVMLASVFPFPILCKTVLNEKLKMVLKAMGILLRKLSTRLELKHSRKDLLHHSSEILILFKIIEQGMEICNVLLMGIQMEYPFYSLDGYRSLFSHLSNIIISMKGINSSKNEFMGKSEILFEFRKNMGKQASLFSNQLALSFLLLDDDHNQKGKEEMKERIKEELGKLGEKFKEERRNLLENNNQFFFTPPPLSSSQINEFLSIYFFIFNLYGIGMRMVQHKEQKKMKWSWMPIWEGTREAIYDIWVWVSPENPSFRQYISSRQFFERLEHAILFGIAVVISVLFCFIKPISQRFYNSFPSTIATTTVLIFGDNSASTWRLSLMRLGGTVLGNLYVFMMTQIIVVGESRYEEVVLVTLFVGGMSFLSLEFQELVSVATFVSIQSFFPTTPPPSFVNFAYNTILQTFMSGLIVIGLSSYKWFFNFGREKLKKIYLLSLLTIQDCTLDCFSSLLHLGEGGDIEKMIEGGGYNNVKVKVLKIKRLTMLLPRFSFLLSEEPYLWRFPLHLEILKKIRLQMEELQTEITWFGRVSSALTTFPSNEVKILIDPFSNVFNQISQHCKLALNESILIFKTLGKLKRNY